MPKPRIAPSWLFLAGVLLAPAARAGGPAPAGTAPASPDLVVWFQTTEQRLFDAIAPGDAAPWAEIMDPDCLITTEEGVVLGREQFLKELGPLPSGLSGAIAVRELTVQALGEVAIVRFLADEKESVFGQELATQYRITDTFRRVAGAWKLVASHASVVTRDPPRQTVSTAAWPSFVGRYQVAPGGWVFTVELREGVLFGGRDPKQLREMIPMAPDVFVVTGRLGEWIFVADESGKVSRLVELRKFEPLLFARLGAG